MKNKSNKKIKLTKPIKYVSDPYYDFHEVIDYIEKKYNISTEEYTPKDGFTKEQIKEKESHRKTPYLNFMHWLTDRCEIHNGACFYLPQIEKDEEYQPGWVQEILQLIYDEFKDDDMYVKIDW